MIVTKLYYDETYFGSTLTDAMFNKYNARAEDDINAIAQFSYDDLHVNRQELIKKAICAQIDFYALNGETYNSDDEASESIGRYSYSAKSGQRESAFAPRAMQYLEMAGVMSRAINRFDESYSGYVL